MGLLREGEGVAARVMETLNADPQKIRSQVRKIEDALSPWTLCVLKLRFCSIVDMIVISLTHRLSEWLVRAKRPSVQELEVVQVVQTRCPLWKNMEPTSQSKQKRYSLNDSRCDQLCSIMH